MSDRLISADALRQRMYNDAFETDTEMQRWDGGCWIRYKMFENALEDAPTIDAESVVRCKDCKHNQLPPTSGNADCELWYGMTDLYGYCHYGERREDGKTD